jgi:pimeloyl-ACP methyl ester carboxylesterase
MMARPTESQQRSLHQQFVQAATVRALDMLLCLSASVLLAACSHDDAQTPAMTHANESAGAAVANAGTNATATSASTNAGSMADVSARAGAGGSASGTRAGAGTDGSSGMATAGTGGGAGTASGAGSGMGGSTGAAAGATSTAGASGGSNAAGSGEIMTTQINASGFVFDARVAGPESGELVVLLHGFPETSYEWRSQLAGLGKAGYRAVAPNQRGYSPGARPSAIDDYKTQVLAQDVVAIADALGAQRFHVVGHDWGASVAWFVGHFAAERVITLNTFSVPHPDAFAAQLADKSSCQYSASSYFDFFSMDNSENQLLASNAALLRSLYGGIDASTIDEYLRVLNNTDALHAAHRYC